MSSTTAIHVENLSKHFGRGKRRVDALTDISFEVQSGQVYGFLGPNGAGKTTTIRMLLDLVRPTRGSVTLFGQPVRENMHVLRRIGAMVEGATFYPFLSGRRNLEVLARTGGLLDRRRIQTLLETVGMADRADRRARGYSTGMKQRLGLAAALLSDPDLIILDEPTNGLDPAGIQEIRTLIRQLVDQHGKTVFLSSHMLNEVEQVCDRVAIIHRGQLIREGTVESLLAENTRLRVEAAPLERARQIIAGRWSLAPNGETGLLVEAGREDAPHLVRALTEAGVDIYEVAVQRQSLEAYFLAAIQGEK
ncbi:MAG: ABC transporter ATP-binding protein [Anaerolineae bacterium]|nr:ABC transporter ATP-binding protein [Anaerolineae bacterium]